MKRLFTLAAIVGCLFLNGCGTILMRDYPSCRPTPDDIFSYYPATHYDGIIITEGGGIYSYGDCNNGLGPVLGWTVVVPIHIIDLPISLVTDTVLLLLDMIHNKQRQKRIQQGGPGYPPQGVGSPEP